MATGSLCLPGSLQATEIPMIFHPVRPMALGGAFTAIANDASAVWTNPAGISRVRKHRSRSRFNLVRFPGLIAGANESGQAFFSTLGSDEAQQAEALSSGGDNPYWAMAAANPMVMFNTGRQMAWAVGGFNHTTLRATPDSEDSTLTETSIVADVGGHLGFSLTNRTNRFNVGFQVRSISRYAFEGAVPTAELSDQGAMQERLSNEANKSLGLAVDIGAMATLADYWFPTIGIAMLNAPLGCKNDYLNPFSRQRETICGTVYQGSFANPDAVSTIDPTDFRVGVSITPRFSRKLAMRLAADLHNILLVSGTNNFGFTNLPIEKQIHAGAELFVGNPLLPSPFTISAGGSQGFSSFGVSLRLGFLTLDFASFGRDISSTSAPLEDRRYVGAFSLDF